MQTVFIEVGHSFNWGKFAVARFEDEEWSRPSVVGLKKSLLCQRGWGRNHLWVLDLETGEGVFILPGGYAHSDLEKHAVWVCPMFETFLEWLYRQDLSDLTKLPKVLHLTEKEAPGALWGYRRKGRRKSK